MAPAVTDAALAYCRGALRREATSNFGRLRRIPSTFTWRAVDYVSSLGDPERQRLFETLARRGLVRLFTALPPPPDDPDDRAFRDGVLRRSGPEYYDARMLRAILGDLRSSRPSPELLQTPPEVIRRAASITPTSAAEIRKSMKAVLAERFGATPHNETGGVWHYRGGRSAGREFRLSVDYGGRSDQLRYDISYDDERSGIRARRLTYEGLLGFGLGQWDFVTAGNLNESIALLCELVEEMVGLPDRLLPAEC